MVMLSSFKKLIKNVINSNINNVIFDGDIFDPINIDYDVIQKQLNDNVCAPPNYCNKYYFINTFPIAMMYLFCLYIFINTNNKIYIIFGNHDLDYGFYHLYSAFFF